MGVTMGWMNVSLLGLKAEEKGRQILHVLTAMWELKKLILYR